MKTGVNPTQATSQLVIIGVGHPYRGDDAVGHVVAGCLAKELGEQGQIRLLLEPGEGTRLMAAWKSAGIVILIDATLSGAEPGTLYRIDAVHQSLVHTWWRCTTPAFGVAEAIEFARLLHELPAHLLVYGIEGASFATGAPLSEAVERVIPKVLLQVRHDIASLATDEVEGQMDGVESGRLIQGSSGIRATARAMERGAAPGECFHPGSQSPGAPDLIDTDGGHQL
jgi:hydrogenase maturation protease